MLAVFRLASLVAAIVTLWTSTDAGAAILAGPPRQTAELRSNLAFHEVRVPFTLIGTAIILKANISGKSVDCLLDTGFTGLLVPDQLGVATTPAGKSIRRQDAAGHVVESKSVLVATLQIGDCTIRNVRASVLDTSGRTNGAGDFNKNTVLIGTTVLKDTVVTIDYLKHEIILRDAEYDCGARMTSDDILLPFQLANHGHSSYGLPVVTGRVGGKPANLVIDTGFTATAVALQQRYVAGNPVLRSKTDEATDGAAVFGQTTFHRIKSVSFSLNAISQLDIMGDALQVSIPSREIDGAIGGVILSQFRVTFDFPRKRVLLEPYDPNYRKRLMQGQDPAESVAANSIIGKDGARYVIPPGTTVGPGPGNSVIITYPGHTPITVELPDPPAGPPTHPPR